jgi:hypothetical protein
MQSLKPENPALQPRNNNRFPKAHLIGPSCVRAQLQSCRKNAKRQWVLTPAGALPKNAEILGKMKDI